MNFINSKNIYLRIAILVFAFSLAILALPKITFAACADVPIGGNYTISSSCTFSETVDGVDNGGITINEGQTLTVNNGQTIVWSPGSSIVINGSAAINVDGQFRQTYIWYTDQDNDGYPTTGNAVAQDAQPSNGKRRKDFSNFTYITDFTRDYDDTLNTIYPGTACGGVCYEAKTDGTCGVAAAGTDPGGECGAENCEDVNCDGSGACQILSTGEGACSLCYGCSDSDVACDAIGNGTRDTIGTYQSATCYSCNGAGTDTARTVDGSSATALGCSEGASEGCRKCASGVCGYYTSAQNSCAGGEECDATGTCASVTKYILYVTDTSYDGNLGGRSGADTKCDTDTNKPAACSGTAWAFLSVSADDEIQDMLTTKSVNSSSAWYRSDLTTRLATDWADLLDGEIENRVEETTNIPRWTGSNIYGTIGGSCNGWTANNPNGYIYPASGNPPWCTYQGQSGADEMYLCWWLSSGSFHRVCCDATRYLYCSCLGS